MIFYWLIWRIPQICINFCFELRITARQIPQTKHEIVMIHKTNSSPLSGKCGLLHTIKQGKSSQTSRACWSFFWLCRHCFIRNLFLQAKRLTNITTGWISNIWRTKSSKNFKNNGVTKTGIFTILMCSNFWPTESMFLVPYPPYSPDMAPVLSSCFHEW